MSEPSDGALSQQHDRLCQRLEGSVAISLTLGAIILHVRYFMEAGPLWRDEVHSVNLAAAGGFTNIFTRFKNDSFPVLWQLVLWLWQHLGMDNTDHQLRALGLCAGL